MHTKEEVELFLLARGDGMTLREAAVFAGVGMGAAKRWSAGDLPRSYTDVADVADVATPS